MTTARYATLLILGGLGLAAADEPRPQTRTFHRGKVGWAANLPSCGAEAEAFIEDHANVVVSVGQDLRVNGEVWTQTSPSGSDVLEATHQRLPGGLTLYLKIEGFCLFRRARLAVLGFQGPNQLRCANLRELHLVPPRR